MAEAKVEVNPEVIYTFIRAQFVRYSIEYDRESGFNKFLESEFGLIDWKYALTANSLNSAGILFFLSKKDAIKWKIKYG